MATIKDIARAAGVSHATVSNVLNHKGIVSAEKVKLVQDTARAMGYRLNEAASSLRSGKARVLAVVLPDTDSSAYDDLYRSLYLAAQEKGYSTLLRLTGNVPAAERDALHDVLSARARYVVSVTSLSAPEEDYAELKRSGAGIAFALRDAPEDMPLLGFDMRLAGREIAQKAISEGAVCVGLMTSMIGYASEAAFCDAFHRELEKVGAHMLHVQSITSQYARQAFSLFDTDRVPDAVVTTSEEMARAVLQASVYLHVPTPKIYTLGASRLLPPTQYRRYALNYRKLGTMIFDRLMEGNNAPLLLRGEGFAPDVSLPSYRRSVLRMLASDSPFARALVKLSPRLEQDTGIRLSLDIRETGQVTHALEHWDEAQGYDLARMDMALLSRCAKQLFVPVSELELDQAQCGQALLSGLTEEYGQVDGTCYALPLDPSCHLLFYRQDLISNPHFQRRYYETYHESAEPFGSYEQYLHTAQCLQQMAQEEGLLQSGTLLTGRASEWLGDLASLSENGCWPRLTIDQWQAFLERRRALDKVALRLGDGGWNTAVRCFAQGNCALMIAHSNYAGLLADNPLSNVSGRVGYAPTPGKRPLLGGGVVGVLRSSPHAKEASAFLRWIYSPGVRDLLALLSGCSPCRSVYENEQILDVYPWLPTVRQGLQIGVRRRLFPQVVGNGDQMSVEHQIADFCRQAVTQKLDPLEALERINECAK